MSDFSDITARSRWRRTAEPDDVGVIVAWGGDPYVVLAPASSAQTSAFPVDPLGVTDAWHDRRLSELYLTPAELLAHWELVT